jgi:hypothetical protein
MHRVTVCALAALAVLVAPIHAQTKRTNGPVWKAVSPPQCDGLDQNGNYKGVAQELVDGKYKGKVTDKWQSEKCKNMHKEQASAEVTYPGEKDPVAIRYMIMARSGDKLGDGTFGALIDSKGQPISDMNGPVVSHAPDSNNILTAYNQKMYAVTHFESPVPSVAYLSEVTQESDGTLKYTKTQNIDFSKVGGLWIPCAGSISPWGSHLGSEEYEPDGRAFYTSTESKVNITAIDGKKYEVVKFLTEDLVNMAIYLGKDPKTWKDGPAAVKEGLNPYNYGWPWEVKVNADGKPTEPQKLYAIGRMSYEQLTGEPLPFFLQFFF